MTDENLRKIVDGPVYLLEGKDGIIYGNSQAMALEVLRLREALRPFAQQHEAFLKANPAYSFDETDIGSYGKSFLDEHRAWVAMKDNLTFFEGFESSPAGK